MLQLVMLAVATIIPLQSSSTELKNVRQEYFNIDSEKKLIGFLNKTELSYCNTTLAYWASAKMMQAKYAFSPIKKWQYFKEGRDALERMVKGNPNSAEIRFVRYVTQSNTPSFLNYSRDLESDKEFILKNINNSHIPINYKTVIYSYLQ